MRLSSYLIRKRPRMPQNEKKVPVRESIPLKLKNEAIANTGRKLEASCLFEMTTLLLCLKDNDYENKMCNKEFKNFSDCYTMHLNQYKEQKLNDQKGIIKPGTKTLSPRQTTQLLRMYPTK